MYKNYDKMLNDSIESEMKRAKKRSKIEAEIKLVTEEQVILKVKKDDIEVEVTSELSAEEAKKPMDEEKIREKLSELGETEFILEKSEIIYDGKAFFPFALLKELRNRAVELLRREIIEKSRRRKEEKGIFAEKNREADNSDYVVSAFVKSIEQEELLKRVGIEKIYRRSWGFPFY